MSLIKTLFRELKLVFKSKQRSMFFNYFMVALLLGLLPIVLVIMPRMIVSYIEEGKSFNELARLVIICSSIVLVFSGLGSYFEGSNQAKSTTFRINEYINFFRIYLKTDYENIENPEWLDKIDRQRNALNGDNDGYQGTLDTITRILPYIVTGVIYSIILAMLSPYLLICIAGVLVLSMISINRGRAYEYSKKSEAARNRRRQFYFAQTASDFSYTKDIKVFNLKSKILGSLKKEANIYKKLRCQIEGHIFLWSILEVIAIAILFGTTLYFAIDKYQTNGLISDLLLYIMVVSSLLPVLASITLETSTLVRNLKDVKEYFAYIDENKKNEEVLPEININETLEIEFKDVCFKYPNTDKYIFKNLSFKINKCEKVAIVGVNGAGKSTIVKLILGFFRPTSGEILINGHDINTFNRDDLYKLYGVVFQDVNVYAFSILENVSLKESEKTDREKVLSNLERVELLDYINKLPNKENQSMLKYLDNEGVELSGGQTQKLAIARALYKENTHCVILDEPTAALDALAEAKIYESFSDLVENKTAIYISHRLSSTKFCDRIMLFEGEGLAECGSHQELMKLRGKYYEVFEIQGKYYKEGQNEESTQNI